MAWVGRPRYARVLGNPHERRELGALGNVEEAMMRRYRRDTRQPRPAVGVHGPGGTRRYGQSPEDGAEAIADAPARFLPPPGHRSGR